MPEIWQANRQGAFGLAARGGSRSPMSGRDRSLQRWAPLALILVAVACHPASPRNKYFANCSTPDDCASSVCYQGLCTSACVGNGDCGAAVCVSGDCKPLQRIECDVDVVCARASSKAMIAAAANAPAVAASR